MENTLKRSFIIGSLVIGGSVTMLSPSTFAESKAIVTLNNMTSEEQAALYTSVSKLNFKNEDGNVRVINPGEALEIIGHEEDNSISFSTLDGYTVDIHNTAAFSTSPNVGGVVSLENSQLYAR